MFVGRNQLPRRRVRWVAMWQMLGIAAVAVLQMALAGCGHHDAASMTEVPGLLKKGWDATRLNEYDEAEGDFKDALAAIDAFEKLPAVSASPVDENKWHTNALYGLGLVDSLGYHGTRDAEMRNDFQQVIALDQSPDHAMAAWALEALVRDAQMPKGSDESASADALIPRYQEVLDRYPNTAAAEEAFTYQQALILQKLTPQAAQQVIDGVTAYLAKHPGTRFKSSLLDMIGNGYVILGKPELAFPYSQGAFLAQENDPSNPNSTRAGALYSLGLAALYDVGDFPAARHYFNAFLQEFPTDQKAYVVKLQLRKIDQLEAQFKASATASAGGGH